MQLRQNRHLPEVNKFASVVPNKSLVNILRDLAPDWRVPTTFSAQSNLNKLLQKYTELYGKCQFLSVLCSIPNPKDQNCCKHTFISFTLVEKVNAGHKVISGQLFLFSQTFGLKREKKLAKCKKCSFSAL